MSFNKVILMGNLTRDPEMKTLPSGMRTARLGLAITERWKDQATNELKENTLFLDVDAWDKQADFAGQYLTKGQSVLIDGSLKMDEWTTKEGEKRSKMRVRATTIRFAGPKPAGGAGASPAPQAAAPSQTTPAAAPAGVAEEPGNYLAQDDEQLPF